MVNVSPMRSERVDGETLRRLRTAELRATEIASLKEKGLNSANKSMMVSDEKPLLSKMKKNDNAVS